MSSMALFNLAMRQNEWLSQRQSVIAGNIANANTPAYKARDIEKFNAVMDGMSSLSATNAGHFTSGALQPGMAAEVAGKSGEVLQSGNNVSLEQEFLKTGEVMKQFTFNNQVVKAFNRMLFAAAKA